MMKRRYLSNWIVSAKGVVRLSIITIDDAGKFESLEPFEQEVANTEYVQGVIVVIPQNTEMTPELLKCHIGESNAKTAENVFKVIKDSENRKAAEGQDVVLYAVDSFTHLVKKL